MPSNILLDNKNGNLCLVGFSNIKYVGDQTFTPESENDSAQVCLVKAMIE